jgi:NitT/TauT family transport system permease protein
VAAHIKRDRIVTFLPFLAGALVLLQYFLVPNAQNAELTMVFPTFILLLMGFVMLLQVASLFHNSCYQFLRERSAWYAAIFFCFLLIDFLTLKQGYLSLPMFPWPDRLLNEIILDRASLLDCAGNSLRLLFTGYFYGMAAGLITGILGGRSRHARYWIAPILKALGPIPAVTWMAPFFVLSASLFQGCVLMVAYSVWYPVATGTMHSILQVNKAYGEVAKTLGATKEIQLVCHVTIPHIMPGIFQGLTSGMRAACASLMIAEMMGVESGLAWYMTWQRGWGNFTKMYTAVLVICVVFILVDAALGLLKKNVLRWQEAQK